MNDLISVIIPVHNVENYIGKCIESVKAQTYDNWELILIDDGSTDSSGKICDEYAYEDSRIKVFHKPNGGVSSARNMGLDKKNGEYIIFLDSDDIFDKEMLYLSYKTIKAEDVDATCAGVRSFEDGTGKTLSEVYTFESSLEMTGEEAFSRLLTRNGLDSNIWGKLYKAKLWEDIRFPDGHIFEDILVTYKILLKCKRIIHLGKILYSYRVRKTSITGSAFSNSRQDYTNYSKQIYEFTKEKYPQYKKDARIFYLNAVVENYLRIGRLDDKSEFLEYYKYLKNEIICNYNIIILSDYFSGETKIAVTLNLFGIYKSIRNLIHRGR